VHQKNVLTSCSTTRSKGGKNGAPEKETPCAIPAREEHDAKKPIPGKEKLITVKKSGLDDDETYYSAEEEPEAEGK
jgi:hypothetical protein